MAMFGPSRPSFQSGKEEFPTFLKVSNKPASSSNSGPSLAPFQVSKYIKDDFQQILKTVLKARSLTACGPDQRTFKDPPERVLKPRTPDIYKAQSYIDCYNSYSGAKTISPHPNLETAIESLLPPHSSRKKL